MPEEFDMRHSDSLNTAVSALTEQPATSTLIALPSKNVSDLYGNNPRSKFAQDCSSDSTSKDAIRASFELSDESTLSRHADAAFSNRAVPSMVQRSNNEEENNKALQELQLQVSQLTNSLESSSLSEQKRFAIKKDLAKARANLLRLSRNNACTSR